MNSKGGDSSLKLVLPRPAKVHSQHIKSENLVMPLIEFAIYHALDALTMVDFYLAVRIKRLSLGRKLLSQIEG